jgi:hypothetical protein
MTPMNNTEFNALMDALKEYLDKEKVFIKNPERFADIERATEIASALFSDMDIIIKDDPLQMGALIIKITGLDITVRGEREIALFKELISKADNFEIYAFGDDDITFSILFNHALVRLQ